MNEEIIDMESQGRFRYHSARWYDLRNRTLSGVQGQRKDRRRVLRSAESTVSTVWLSSAVTVLTVVHRHCPDLVSIPSVFREPSTWILHVPSTQSDFDTAVNTAMQAIDKVKDTSSSHERCSIIEVMGRNAGYIALWCGIANGAEDILLPEKYDYNEQNIINNIITNRKHGKTHHIIINAEGIGHSTSMARRIEAATGIETRATILGYMQRGGSPTAKDRYYASIMGAYAVDIMLEGKTNRVVGYQHGEFIDFDIEEALQMQKGINEYQFEVSHLLSI